MKLLLATLSAALLTVLVMTAAGLGFAQDTATPPAPAPVYLDPVHREVVGSTVLEPRPERPHDTGTDTGTDTDTGDSDGDDSDSDGDDRTDEPAPVVPTSYPVDDDSDGGDDNDGAPDQDGGDDIGDD